MWDLNSSSNFKKIYEIYITNFEKKKLYKKKRLESSNLSRTQKQESIDKNQKIPYGI